MTLLVLMYVFFDKNGDIKAITPTLDEDLSVNFFSATFPLSDVEVFLTAEKNTFDYHVSRIDKLSGTTYKLVKKRVEISYTRTLDSYLTKIEDINKDDIIIITNNTIEKYVSLVINWEFREMYKNMNNEDALADDEFFNNGLSTVYLTKRNNPYHLLFSFSFTPKDLLAAGKLYFNYEGDYTNASVYTKKLLSGYGYREKVAE